MILREYQGLAVDRVRQAFRDGARAVLLVIPTGGGKCLARGTPVMLHDGRVIPVEDVAVGDRLMGPDSAPRRVFGLARGREEMFRITPRRGDSYTVNRSHILSVKMTNGSKHSCGVADGSVVNLTIDDYLRRSKSFQHCAKGWRAAVDFPSHGSPLKIDPYFLGLWLGDGASDVPMITTGDPEIEAFVRSYAAALGLLVREAPNSANSVNLHITTGEMARGRGHRHNPLKLALHQLALLGAKHVPHRYLTGSRAERLEVLAGILDSDGHWSGKGYDLCLKDERLFDGVLFLARSLGFSAVKAEARKVCHNNGVPGLYWRCSINGPVDTIPCRVARKKAPPRQQKKDPLMTGISVESIGEGDYFGFEIAGPDRLFLLGDFTVTHNTIVFGHVTGKTAAAGKRVLIAAHRRELIRQASEKLTAAGTTHGIVAPGFTPSGEFAQVGSIQTIRRRLDKLPPPYLIVADEAHHTVSGEWQAMLQAFPDALLLGVTATPERLDGLGLGKEAAGPFDVMVIGPTVQELIDDGYLTGTRVFAPAEAPDLRGVRSRGGDYEAGQVSKVMERPQIVGDAVQHYIRHARGQPAILFSPSVRHAEIMAAAFRDAGYRGVAVSGETETHVRDAAIRGLATSETQVLCSCDLISEGLDVPAVGCVILMRPTQSLGLYLQQVGRGLRPIYAPGYPLDNREGRLAAIAASSKPRLMVLDHAGNSLKPNFGMIEEPREWTLAGKRPKDPVAKARQCPACFAVHPPTSICPECGHSYAKAAAEGPGRKGPQVVKGELGEMTPEMAKAIQADRRRSIESAQSLEDLKKVAKILKYKRGWAEHYWGARVRKMERQA